jgi:hypothetical protein
MFEYGEDYQAWLGIERITKHGWAWRRLPRTVGYREDYQAWLGFKRITKHTVVGHGEYYHARLGMERITKHGWVLREYY